MKTLKLFKISENEKKFDIVELLYNELEKKYIVRWKWTTMKEQMQKKYNDYYIALNKYNERKVFAKLCN